MLDLALRFLVSQANTHLQKSTGAEVEAVNMGALVDDKGNWVQPGDTLRLALFQIEEERTLREPLPERVLVGGRELSLPPPLKLNVIVVAAARFQQYDQGLKHLSLLLTFLQAHPLFTPATHPGLPAGLDRLTAELVSWGPEQLNQMWSCMGAKHLPSVIYRLRMLWLRDSEPLGSGAPVTTIDTRLHGR